MYLTSAGSMARAVGGTVSGALEVQEWMRGRYSCCGLPSVRSASLLRKAVCGGRYLDGVERR